MNQVIRIKTSNFSSNPKLYSHSHILIRCNFPFCITFSFSPLDFCFVFNKDEVYSQGTQNKKYKNKRLEITLS